MSDRSEDRLVEGQSVKWEVETLRDLSTHSPMTVYYIAPDANGDPGVIDDAVALTGTAVAGISGSSVNQSDWLHDLSWGIYRFWSESYEGINKFTSVTKEAFVEKRGVIYRR